MTFEAGTHERDAEVNREIFSVFKKFGRQSSAYFIFQDHVKCFNSDDYGYVYYARQTTPLGAVNLVFTNPLCSKNHMLHLLKAFLATQSIPSIFVSVSIEVANALRELGYFVNQTGTESRIRLDDFDLHGHAKKQLRHASNFGKRTNSHVKELLWSQVDEQQARDLSDKWRRSKGVSTRELKYATRPPVFRDEWQVRKFYCFQGDRMIAYVFFDPYFDQGELKGYCANILRALPEKETNGALDYTILEAIKQFREEGVAELSLGVAPMQNIKKEPGDRRLMRWLSQGLYEYGNSLYSFKGLAYHKTRYRPIETPWYLCTKDVSLFRAYWGLMFGLKVLGTKEL